MADSLNILVSQFRDQLLHVAPRLGYEVTHGQLEPLPHAGIVEFLE